MKTNIIIRMVGQKKTGRIEFEREGRENQKRAAHIRGG